MNKTLLLIMCDFMLLNLLALTRWEKAEPSHTQLETAAPRSAANAPAVNADMVELMRISLEDEKASREQLASQLASTQGSLSEREKEVLLLAAVGHTNREIAKVFHLSEQPVHNYRATAMEKLGLHDRTQLLKFAIRRGIVSVADL